jgi:hypothetical protein
MLVLARHVLVDEKNFHEVGRFSRDSIGRNSIASV